jgi:acetyltransferase-like isoleucine patch superfamily enzyme
VAQSFKRLRRRASLVRAARKTGTRRLAAFGSGSVVVPPATILSPHRIEIGNDVLIFENATFSVVEDYRGRQHAPRLRIGDGTVIGHSIWFSCVGEITVGERVLIGHGVLIADSFHEYADPARPILLQPMAEPRRVIVGSGAIVGPGAAILSGSTIGENAYVVPNAVVVGDVPPRSVVAGNPARVIRRWDASTERWLDDPNPAWAPLLATLTR